MTFDVQDACPLTKDQLDQGAVGEIMYLAFRRHEMFDRELLRHVRGVGLKGNIEVEAVGQPVAHEDTFKMGGAG